MLSKALSTPMLSFLSERRPWNACHFALEIITADPDSLSREQRAHQASRITLSQKQTKVPFDRWKQAVPTLRAKSVTYVLGTIC